MDDTSMPLQHERPLAGVRVIDLTHVIAGPLCTMYLADAGADVIKVEPPGGEWARHNGVSDSSADDGPMPFFAAVNRSKRSIELDLRSELGIDTLKALILRSDVVVENYAPGALARLGLDLDDLRRQHPGLVTASISLFGRAAASPDLEGRLGIQSAAEAESGLLVDERARLHGIVPSARGVGDPASGLATYAGVCAALFRRERTAGTGSHVDVSMVATTGMFNVASVVLAQLAADPAAGRYAGFGIYPAMDGYIALGINSDRLWSRLLEVVDDDRLASERFSELNSRNLVADEVDRILADWTSHLGRHELVKRFVAARVPCGSVRTLQEILADPASRELGLVCDVREPGGRVVTTAGNPWGLITDEPRLPDVGEHTSDVLQEVLGIDQSAVASLRERGAFGPSAYRPPDVSGPNSSAAAGEPANETRRVP